MLTKNGKITCLIVAFGFLMMSVTELSYSDNVDNTFKEGLLNLEIETIPGWKITTNSEFKLQYEKSIKALQNVTEKNQHLLNANTLLLIEKDRVNSMHVYCTPFSEKVIPDYKKHAVESNQFIIQTLKDKGILYQEESSETKINNTKYFVFKFKFFNQNKQLLFIQEYYNNLVEQCDLVFLLTYNSDENKDALYKTMNSVTLD